MRTILINGIVYPIDISDGKGDLPFGMWGDGSMRLVLDGTTYEHSIVYNDTMLDGKIEYVKEISMGKVMLKPVDTRIKTLESMREFNYSNDGDLDISYPVLLQAVFFCLRYYPLRHIQSGYGYGMEFEFDHICITADSEHLVIYSAAHNGFMARNLLTLKRDDNDFERMLNSLRGSIMDYAGIWL